MGEAKLEEAKTENKPEKEKVEEKKEEKVEEKKEEKVEAKKEEENVAAKKEEKAPPPPIILFVDMHCVGCAKKVERCLMKCRGVEEVQVDINKNEVMIKGIVEPQALCSRLQKKTKRRAKVLSPPSPPEGDAAQPQSVSSQVNEVTTVVLLINMHCEACAKQLKRRILKMRGVQSAETELSNSKVTVTGTMEANKLVDYIYRRTRRQAKIVPPPEPEKPKEEPPAAPTGEAKPAEEAPKAEEKKGEEKPEEKEKAAVEEKKEINGGNNAGGVEKQEEEKNVEEKVQSEGKKEGDEMYNNYNHEDMAKKIVYWPPVYVIHQPPPPQLFSDENPNACCIS